MLKNKHACIRAWGHFPRKCKEAREFSRAQRRKDGDNLTANRVSVSHRRVVTGHKGPLEMKPSPMTLL